jgi:preprotein translocase subunit SecA
LLLATSRWQVESSKVSKDPRAQRQQNTTTITNKSSCKRSDRDLTLPDFLHIAIFSKRQRKQFCKREQFSKKQSRKNSLNKQPRQFVYEQDRSLLRNEQNKEIVTEALSEAGLRFDTKLPKNTITSKEESTIKLPQFLKSKHLLPVRHEEKRAIQPILPLLLLERKRDMPPPPSSPPLKQGKSPI